MVLQWLSMSACSAEVITSCAVHDSVTSAHEMAYTKGPEAVRDMAYTKGPEVVRDTRAEGCVAEHALAVSAACVLEGQRIPIMSGLCGAARGGAHVRGSAR